MSSAGEQIASSDAGLRRLQGAANTVGGIAIRCRRKSGPRSIVPCVRRGVDRGGDQCHQGELILRTTPQGHASRVSATESSRAPCGRRSDTISSTHMGNALLPDALRRDFSQRSRSGSEGLDYLKLDGGLPNNVKTKVRVIADDKGLSFDQVKDCLDNVSILVAGLHSRAVASRRGGQTAR